ncbi:hypothetical protein KC367_g5517 [Hortaea werneckii]|nr:hypothetical protein KC358_g7161 [Hortaea werneckii]KAI6834777.1 hypothetical protein KC350_g6661 [Hortaea werneckii]KAI6930190.1 hypothetical protein KC348_g7649 [Hortaea werneckii]KAI6935278.1 hypothetical protein KC341_g7046 [Hortaea werneckii]KAI6970024.1 hypothetical protein KC321_g7555 [Hortaea werneckii]
MADDSDQITAFKQGLSKLLKNGSLTDLTFVYGALTHKVHKVILCAHSDYFAALPNFVEGETNTIRFKAIGDDDDDEACDDPEAIKLMIHYFYHLDYTATIASNTSPSSASGTGLASKAFPPPEKKNGGKASFEHTTTRALASSSHDDDMVMHAKVFAAAVKYQVAALSKLAAKKFKEAVEVNWRHETFAEAVHTVYSTTPADIRALRDVATTTLDRHADTLLQLGEVVQVVKASKEIMFDLLCKGRGLASVEPKASSSSSNMRDDRAPVYGNTYHGRSYGFVCSNGCKHFYDNGYSYDDDYDDDYAD